MCSSHNKVGRPSNVDECRALTALPPLPRDNVIIATAGLATQQKPTVNEESPTTRTKAGGWAIVPIPNYFNLKI